MPRPVIRIEPPYMPELLGPVRDEIRDYLSRLPFSTVFEYGSGYSTLWLAGLADEVISVEHDPDWFDEVRRALDEANLPADVRLVEAEQMAEAIIGEDDFDLVLVDCFDDQRMKALALAKEFVKPGGMLVLDDSHWPGLAEADVLMAGWSRMLIGGMHRRRWTHNGVVRYHETAIYRSVVERIEHVS